MLLQPKKNSEVGDMNEKSSMERTVPGILAYSMLIGYIYNSYFGASECANNVPMLFRRKKRFFPSQKLNQKRQEGEMTITHPMVI